MFYKFSGLVQRVDFVLGIYRQILEKKFLGIHLRSLFWAVCRSLNKVDFHDVLTQVRMVDEKAYKWLIKNEPYQWSMFDFDTKAKSDHITNNMVRRSIVGLVKTESCQFLVC